MHRFRALRTLEVHSSLLNLYSDVGLQTVDAKQVSTVSQPGEEVGAQAVHTQRAEPLARPCPNRGRRGVAAV